MLLEATQQAGHLDAARSAVGMHLVKHQKPQVLIEEYAVLLTKQQIFEHRVVRHQDVGQARRVTDLLAIPDRLWGQIRRAHLLVTLRGTLLILGGIAGIAGKRDTGPGQILGEALVLVIRQCIHRVKDEGTDARTRMFEAVIQYGEEKCLGLARPCATRDDRVAPRQDLLDRLLLVSKEAPLTERHAAGLSSGRKELLVEVQGTGLLGHGSLGSLVWTLEGQEGAAP